MKNNPKAWGMLCSTVVTLLLTNGCCSNPIGKVEENVFYGQWYMDNQKYHDGISIHDGGWGTYITRRGWFPVTWKTDKAILRVYTVPFSKLPQRQLVEFRFSQDEGKLYSTGHPISCSWSCIKKTLEHPKTVFLDLSRDQEVRPDAFLGMIRERLSESDGGPKQE